LLTVSRSFMNVANSVLWRMAIILKATKVNLFVPSVLIVFWYHSPNLLDAPRVYWKLTTFTVQVSPHYLPVTCSKTYCGYMKPRIILNAIYNVIFV
jgi:hypothetical protein